MKNLFFGWVYLFLLFSSVNGSAEQVVFWSKMEIIAELPAPYGETRVAFLTTEQGDKQLVRQVEMSNTTGHWMFTHPELELIPVEALTTKSGIALEKNCVEFQTSCISFLWLIGEPQYITFPIGGTTEFFQHVYLKVSEHGLFDFKIVDRYQEGLEQQQAMTKLLKELEEQTSEVQLNDELENIAFPFPVIYLPRFYYGSRVFYYELPALLGSLSIKNTIVDALAVDYSLILPSGGAVDLARIVKDKGLRFSGLSDPLVSFDAVTRDFFITIPCLLDKSNEDKSFMAVKLKGTERNRVITTDVGIFQDSCSVL